MTGIRLSDSQRRAVEHNDGALIVVAGPGSGKTRVLTERVRRLLTVIPGHFRVLALTFTNKAANEMMERLTDLGDARHRAFIGTFHGFCLEVLTDRGKLVGVDSPPHIFEQFQDRKQILAQAVEADPLLASEFDELDLKGRNQKLDDWLRLISVIKTQPLTFENSDPLAERVVEAYNAGLRACGAYDFDDLLLLTYRLFSDFPKVADFYRRLYRYVCIDEAQDLNEAQYAVIRAFCGETYKNVMMVGDPKQSIYGFTSSGPEYLACFRADFTPTEIDLKENFRSSQAVVRLAQSLDPKYMVEAQLPVQGKVELLVGRDEADEARLVADVIEQLIASGHPDVEGEIRLGSCAVLGRTRFALLPIEKELKSRNLPFYKRLSSTHENESDTVQEFQLALRVISNPKDSLHLTALAKKWACGMPSGSSLTSSIDVVHLIEQWASTTRTSKHMAIAGAVKTITQNPQRLDLMQGIGVLKTYADSLPEEDRRTIYEDLTVLGMEWDQFLRSDNGVSRSIGAFISNMALGRTKQSNQDGIALLTVHSSKGLEYDVVFVVCMADGVFPDYRARGKVKEAAEEKRNAFVAVTRSRRILYLSYPRQRIMPWGDTKFQSPSPFLKSVSFQAGNQ